MDLSGSDTGASEMTAGTMETLARATAAQISSNAPADSHRINVQLYPVSVDHSRDALLTEFGKDTLRDRYLLPGESYQDLFVRVASAVFVSPELLKHLRRSDKRDAAAGDDAFLNRRARSVHRVPTRAFFSFNSVSVAAPTRITATPPTSFARRSWSFSRS